MSDGRHPDLTGGPSPAGGPDPVRIHLWRIGVEVLDRSIAHYEDLASTTRHGHVLVDDASDADLVLFTQAHVCPDPLSLRAFRSSEPWRRFPDRCFVVDFRDRPWCAFPGLYTSMPARHFQPRWQRAWLYPWIDEPSFLPMRSTDPDLLFSFVGGRTHSCRDPILSLTSDRALIEDTSGFDHLDESPEAERRRQNFRTAVRRSKFVLCPRGHGTSSFRLQEVLAAGRVPVIISDEWVEPSGPDWTAATVRWPESRAAALPGHLDGLEARFDEMATAGAALYDQWFSAELMFDRIIDQLLSIDRGQRFPARGIRGRRYGRLALASARGRAVRRLSPSREGRG